MARHSRRDAEIPSGEIPEEDLGELVSVEAENTDVVAVKKEKIGVFVKGWKKVERYSPHSPSVHVTSFNAGEIVWDESILDSLLAQDAPIKVYQHDVESPASGSN